VTEDAAGRRWLAAWWACRQLPEPAAFALGFLGGRAFYRLDARRRDAIRANLRQVLGPSIDPAALERVVRRSFATYGRYWIEAFRLEDLGEAEIRRRLALEGGEHLDAALRLGRGAIFATPHVGNWDAGGAWLAASGYPVTVVVERLRPVELYERFATYRRALGMELLPLDDGPETLRGVLRALRDGRLVALVCDRDLTGGGLPVELFGATARMPGGPASLALRTGAPLLPIAVYFRPQGGHHAVVQPPLPTRREGRLRDDVARVTQALAHRFEELIRAAPEQWHLMQPNWPSDRSNGAAGTL
jgi:KDO2-lipid IV(A) lauroyltransferase